MKMTESMKSEVVRLYFEENREEAEIAARLGISLTDMQSPVHLVPGEADLAQALDWPGTKILMKTGRSLPGVLQLLAQRQLLEKSALVCDCGLAAERVWPNLANQQPAQGETGYFALVIVKE